MSAPVAIAHPGPLPTPPAALAVIGATPRGLALAAEWAAEGARVVVWDADPLVVGGLRLGDHPVDEGVGTALRAAAADGRLTYTAHMADAVAAGEVVAIALARGDVMPLFELYEWLGPHTPPLALA